MGFRRQKQEKLFYDDVPARRRPDSRPAPYTVAASQAPSLEYASSAPVPESVRPNLPVVLHAPDTVSPWRRDVRFAALLVAVVLGLNLGLYYVFNHPLGGPPERMTMRLDTASVDYRTLSLEERVLTYSSIPDEPVVHRVITPRSALYPSLAK